VLYYTGEARALKICDEGRTPRPTTPASQVPILPFGEVGGSPRNVYERRIGQPATFIHLPNCMIDIPGRCWDGTLLSRPCPN